MSNYKNKGQITLVGAGPGDPEMLTLKGLKALQLADIVFYDALVNPLILEHAPNAEHVFVGKRKGFHKYPQSFINDSIVDAALTGQTVVRLKGGDALVFSRASEELEAAAQYGIETKIIPGISAYSGVVAEQQIPITKRCTYESFWITTGHTCDGTISSDISLAAQSTATVVVYMGMTKIKEIVAEFKKYKPLDYPVGIYQNGTLKHENHVVGNLDTIVDLKEHHQLASPAILIFGAAVLDAPSIIASRLKPKSMQLT